MVSYFVGGIYLNITNRLYTKYRKSDRKPFGAGRGGDAGRLPMDGPCSNRLKK